MYSNIGSAIRYIRYYLTASNGKGHGVHSPFVFDFIINVLNDDRHFYAYASVEELRMNNAKTVFFNEKKFGQLLFRIANYYSHGTMLELGTSDGLRTAYLAFASENSPVITCEPDPEKALLANGNFTKLGLENITLIHGNFEEAVPEAVQLAGIFDLAVINSLEQDPVSIFKTMLPALRDHSMLIINDLHSSREMEAAWKRIREDKAVTLSIDLFYIGILLFRKENRIKQHFTIRF